MFACLVTIGISVDQADTLSACFSFPAANSFKFRRPILPIPATQHLSCHPSQQFQKTGTLTRCSVGHSLWEYQHVPGSLLDNSILAGIFHLEMVSLKVQFF